MERKSKLSEGLALKLPTSLPEGRNRSKTVESKNEKLKESKSFSLMDSPRMRKLKESMEGENNPKTLSPAEMKELVTNGPLSPRNRRINYGIPTSSSTSRLPLCGSKSLDSVGLSQYRAMSMGEIHLKDKK